MTPPAERGADATPTKDFFIFMLVRDIGLTAAVVDLLDNCVDGAKRLRPNADYAGLSVRIEADAQHFRIADNCGGISFEIARDYAFRFGRPKEAGQTLHSVGQFGVGMKRALFKLGTKFRIESTSANSRWAIEEDVEAWKEKPGWEFEFAERNLNLDEVPLDGRGTDIRVPALHEGVSSQFVSDSVQARLKSELEAAHEQTMRQGLAITFNGIPLQFRPMGLLSSEQLQPAYEETVYKPEKGAAVTIRLYAGIADSSPSAAGWYVYCNGRLVLEADQTIVTGWGEGDGTAIPKYHNQYARFRGFTFLDSDDAGQLPWKTTKTGVDADSAIYRAVRERMITLMRPVIDFLNALDAEKGAPGEEAVLERAVEDAKSEQLFVFTPTASFVAPKRTAKPPVDRGGRIQYSKPWPEIKRAQTALKVYTLKEVGEKTFEYFYRMECDE